MPLQWWPQRPPANSLDYLPGQINPCNAEHFLTTVDQLAMPVQTLHGVKLSGGGAGTRGGGLVVGEPGREREGVKRGNGEG